MRVLKTNLKPKIILTTLLGSTILLSACGIGDEDLVLGTRDDIVIMKNGVPVDGAATKTAMVEDAPMVLMVPNVEEAIDDTAITTPDIVMEKAETKVTEEIKKVETTVVTDAPKAVPEKTAVLEAVEKKVEKVEVVVSEDQSVTPPSSMEPVKEMVISETKTKVEQEIKKSPVVETMDKVESVSTDVVDKVVETIAETSALKVPKTEMADASKMVEGCTKKVLTPAKMEDGKVIEQPKLETRRVLCQQDLTPGMIAIVQKALITRGYNIGSPDGQLGNKTFNAIESYQRTNGLGIGGFTYETLQHLGVMAK